MTVTRDQLRAARMLLHLRQDELAALSKVGVATIRRFEGGKGIGHLHLDALRRAVEEAGATFSAPDANRGAGVALKVADHLPRATLQRLQADGIVLHAAKEEHPGRDGGAAGEKV